jgi:hypothetical protein
MRSAKALCGRLLGSYRHSEPSCNERDLPGEVELRNLEKAEKGPVVSVGSVAKFASAVW